MAYADVYTYQRYNFHLNIGTEPIIIVPSDPSAVINMTNVADFLENAHYVRRFESLG